MNRAEHVIAHIICTRVIVVNIGNGASETRTDGVTSLDSVARVTI